MTEGSIARLGRRIAMIFGLGRQTAETDETGSTPQLQISLGNREMRSNIPLLQQYGFRSRPRPGTDVLVGFQAGDRSRAVAFATQDQRKRPSLEPGEVCLYHPESGAMVLMRSDGTICLKPASGKVILKGSLEATGDVKAGSISLQSHKHPGVKAGPDSTQKPE